MFCEGRRIDGFRSCPRHRSRGEQEIAPLESAIGRLLQSRNHLSLPTGDRVSRSTTIFAAGARTATRRPPGTRSPLPSVTGDFVRTTRMLCTHHRCLRPALLWLRVYFNYLRLAPIAAVILPRVNLAWAGFGLGLPESCGQTSLILDTCEPLVRLRFFSQSAPCACPLPLRVIHTLVACQ